MASSTPSILQAFQEIIASGADVSVVHGANPEELPAVLGEQQGESKGTMPTMDAEVLEPRGGALDSRLVHAADRLNQLAGFLDGIQRTILCCYIDDVPVLYHSSAAAIRVRQSRRLHTPEKYYMARECLIIPRTGDYLSPATLDRLRSIPDPVLEDSMKAHKGTGNGNGNGNGRSNTWGLREKANMRANAIRGELEEKLLALWAYDPMLADRGLSDDAQWLVVDGSIAFTEPSILPLNTIGVIKSHKKFHFGVEGQRIIRSLAVGHRTSVFRPRPRTTPEYGADNERFDQSLPTWYVRLHKPSNGDIFGGLVRVEIPEKIHEMLEINQAISLTTLANRISAWLIHEMRNCSRPDSRWDRLLYPIHDCEEYLKSRLPDSRRITSALSALA